MRFLLLINSVPCCIQIEVMRENIAIKAINHKSTSSWLCEENFEIKTIEIFDMYLFLVWLKCFYTVGIYTFNSNNSFPQVFSFLVNLDCSIFVVVVLKESYKVEHFLPKEVLQFGHNIQFWYILNT